MKINNDPIITLKDRTRVICHARCDSIEIERYGDAYRQRISETLADNIYERCRKNFEVYEEFNHTTIWGELFVLTKKDLEELIGLIKSSGGTR